MDMLSFATGLAIGKKKYGKKYDFVYHDILENHVPVYTYNIGTHFKWVVGAWIAYERRFELFDNGMDHIYEVTGSDSNKAAAIECYRQVFFSVGIIYKDNEPKYATVINRGFNPSEAWNHWWVADTQTALFYKTLGDYRIGAAQNVICSQFAPDFYWGAFNGYFSVKITCELKYSYQRYTYNSSSGTVEKNGDRTETETTFGINDSIYPYPRLYGGFSDLEESEWRELMHELTEEIYLSAGYTLLNYRILPTPT